MSSYVEEISYILKLSREPNLSLDALRLPFGRATTEFGKAERVNTACSFWGVTRQLAWQGSPLDFDAVLTEEHAAFEQGKAEELSKLPRYRFWRRMEISAQSWPKPVWTDQQRILTQADYQDGDTIIAAEDILRQWSNAASPTPIQWLLADGLSRYPELRLPSNKVL